MSEAAVPDTDEPMPRVVCGDCGTVVELDDIAERWIRKRLRATEHTGETP